MPARRLPGECLEGRRFDSVGHRDFLDARRQLPRTRSRRNGIVPCVGVHFRGFGEVLPVELMTSNLPNRTRPLITAKGRQDRAEPSTNSPDGGVGAVGPWYPNDHYGREPRARSSGFLSTMKLIIDLSDPAVQAQLNAAIDAKLGELTAQRIDETVSRILGVRSERLTDGKLEEIVGRRVDALVRARLAAYFDEPYNGVSIFRRDLLGKMEAMLKSRIAPAQP